MKLKKILVTDGLFPNKYASWRNVELISFLEEYETSFLVKHGKSYAGITFEVDFEHQLFSSYFRNSSYKFQIFDPNYNHLNKFNGGFDGTSFNGKNNHYSYCLTKEKDFNVENFDLIYHIFLGSYVDFNQNFAFEQNKQLVHLYPGGGFVPGQSSQLSRNVNVVTTHPISTVEIEEYGIRHISCLTVPLYLKKEKPNPISHEPSRLNVCFSSLGGDKAKGASKYWWIVTFYKILFPLSKVRFYSVGNCKKNPFIKKLAPMSFRDLENFYCKNIDLYLNLASDRAFNGWPLGLEAVKNGAALLTTDPNNIAEKMNATKYQIMPLKSVLDFICEIRSLDRDSHKLNILKENHQLFVRDYAGFDNQQKRIFRFIREILKDS